MGNIITKNMVLDDVEIVTQETKYLAYIKEHICNVQTAAFNLFKDYSRLLESDFSDKFGFSEIVIRDAITELFKGVETHDNSKFSDSEFNAYRLKFNTTKLEKQNVPQEVIDERFAEAWKHHYENNDHHPNFWLDHEKGIYTDMSLVAIMHMLSDWEAMSIKFGGSTREWYYSTKSNGERAVMTDKTKEITEFLIGILFGVGEVKSE